MRSPNRRQWSSNNASIARQRGPAPRIRSPNRLELSAPLRICRTAFITRLARSGNGLSLLEACRLCYPDCTQTTGLGVLDIFDFLCFQNSFVSGEPYACECDPDPACDIFDFLCFQNAFVAGCP